MLKWEHREIDGRTISFLGNLKKVFAADVRKGDRIIDLIVHYNVLDVVWFEGTVIIEVEEVIGSFVLPSKLIEKNGTFRFTLV